MSYVSSQIGKGNSLSRNRKLPIGQIMRLGALTCSRAENQKKLEIKLSREGKPKK